MGTKIVATSRFGEIEIDEDTIIRFPSGVVGFPDAQNWVMFDGPDETPFQWLQDCDNPDLAFVLMDPLVINPDYTVFIAPSDLERLKLTSTDEAIVLVILTIPSDPTNMTANLLGPLVFNADKKLAAQIVQTDPSLTTKFPVFGEGKMSAAPSESEANA